MASLLGAINDERKSLYKTVEVEIEFKDRVLGAQPQRLEWIEARVNARVNAKKYPEEAREEILADAREKYLDSIKARNNGEVPEADPEGDAELQGWNVFHQDETGLYLESRCIKAMFKDACTQLNVFTKHRGGGGSVGAKQTHNTGMYVTPAKVHFQRDGETLTEADGVLEMPIHVMTAQGKRTSLSRSDYLTQPRLVFTISIVQDIGKNTLTVKRLPKILALTCDIGCGGKRSQGFGQFKIVRADEL